MIFKIVGKESKAFSQDIKNVLRYSEDKKENGHGELIYNNTFSDHVNDISQAFEDAMDTNPNIKKERLLHISASLPGNDSLTNEQFINASLRYLEKMGYENTPTVIYRHSEPDKKEHVHIVLSNVSYDGKKLSQFNDFFKSQKVSREIEKEFGLSSTNYSKEKNQERLNEINVRKYRMSMSLNKISKNPVHIASISELIGKPFSEMNLDKPDTELKLQLGKDYDRVINYLYNNKLVYSTEKEQFIETLEKTLKSSTSLEDYFKRLEDKKIYWDLKLLGGKTTLTYGLSHNSYYLQEKQLPKTFSFQNIEDRFSGKISIIKPSLQIDPLNQKDFLRRNLKRAIRSSRSIEQLSANLEARGISIKYEGNSSGVYGASLWSNSISEPEKYKASEIDRLLSWKNIEQAIKDNDRYLSKSDKKEITPGLQQIKPQALETKESKMPDLRKLGKSFDGEDDSNKKRKRKEGDEEENEKGLSI